MYADCVVDKSSGKQHKFPETLRIKMSSLVTCLEPSHGETAGVDSAECASNTALELRLLLCLLFVGLFISSEVTERGSSREIDSSKTSP